MTYKFQAEDFYDAINSVGTLGSFPHDLSDFFIRNSDKYKEGCKHLHKDMLQQELFVVDMDSLPPNDKVQPFRLDHNELLIALQADSPNMKRMLSITRYRPDHGDKEEMIVVPIIAGQQKHQWNPAGIVIFLRNIDDPENMQLHVQEFPGAIVNEEKRQKLMHVIFDAMNMIAAVMATHTATMTVKTASPLKLQHAAKVYGADVELRDFTFMQLHTN